MAKCTHSKTEQRWEENPPDPFDDDFVNGAWASRTIQTTVDIDLHTYKCTQCGKVMYYSSATRDQDKVVNIHKLDK